MCVILSKASDARQAIEFTTLLPTVNRSEFRKPDRKISVASRLTVINFDMVRAIHRLEHESIDNLIIRKNPINRNNFLASAFIDAIRQTLADSIKSLHDLGASTALGGAFLKRVVLDNRSELAFFVVREMSAGFVERELANVRRKDLAISLFAQFLANKVLQFLTND